MTPRIPPWESLMLSLQASEEIHSVPLGHSCPRRELWRGKDVDGPHFPACGIGGWFGGVVASAQRKTVWKPAQPSSIKPTIHVTSDFESRLVPVL